MIIGFSYSCLNTSLWSAPAFLISDYLLGTSYGILEASTNMGCGVIAIINGLIIDYIRYLPMKLFFVLVLFFTILLTVLLVVHLMGIQNDRGKKLKDSPVLDYTSREKVFKIVLAMFMVMMIRKLKIILSIHRGHRLKDKKMGNTNFNYSM